MYINTEKLLHHNQKKKKKKETISFLYFILCSYYYSYSHSNYFCFRYHTCKLKIERKQKDFRKNLLHFLFSTFDLFVFLSNCSLMKVCWHTAHSLNKTFITTLKEVVSSVSGQIRHLKFVYNISHVCKISSLTRSSNI